MAVLLGPAGYGLMGIYTSISDSTRNFAGMGINTSGVRQIAEAVGSGDSERIARTVTILRRVAFCSGSLGALILLVSCRPVSWLAFKDYEHTGAIALLALAVFFGDISSGQAALVQGMRRISDLAKMSVLGALYGTVFSIPIVYFFHEDGVVPSMICAGAMAILTSWWYARKIQVQRVRITLQQFFNETGALLKMGVVFMASGFMSLGAFTLILILIRNRINPESAGYFLSAWNFSGYYVNFIVQAMGADFYPRLTAVANDHPQCNRLVNEQMEVGLLLAVPGVLATLTVAPLVLQMFFSAKFGPAVEILRWISLGMVLRVASWPMGFVLLAKGARKIFFGVELCSNLIYLALIWAGMRTLGLQGTGVAFFSLYVISAIGLYLIVRRLSGFSLSAQNRKLAFLFIPLLAIVFASWYVLPHPAILVLGGMATCFTGIFSLKILCTLVPLERFPGPVRKMILFFKLASLETNNNHPNQS